MSWHCLRALAVSICSAALAGGLLACGQAAAPTSQVEGASPEAEGEAPAAAAAGKRAPCTLGADQTCNDDERISALWGRCTELGVCECSPGFELNPRGRCQPQAR